MNIYYKENIPHKKPRKSNNSKLLGVFDFVKSSIFNSVNDKKQFSFEILDEKIKTIGEKDGIRNLISYIRDNFKFCPEEKKFFLSRFLLFLEMKNSINLMENILKIFEIGSFDKIINNDLFFKFLNFSEHCLSNKINLKSLLNFIKDKSNNGDLKLFLENRNLSEIQNIINISENNIFKKLLELCFELKDFENIISDENMVYLLKYGKFENFDEVLIFRNISDIKGLKNLLSDINFHHIKKFISNEIKENVRLLLTILEKFSFGNNENLDFKILEGLSNIIIFETKNTLGICPATKEDNNDILTNKSDNYTRIIYKGIELGYIKRLGNETFISFYNIFDENGRLIFISGGIYYIKSRYFLLNKNSYDLSSLPNIYNGNLDINFLKLIDLDNFSSLVQKFLEDKKDIF